MAKKPTPTEEDIHAEAVKRAEEGWLFERDNIVNGREDQKFYAGDQWDDAAKKARGTNRPMLTINRLGTFVRQVTGDIRQNTPAIKVLPARGPASQDKAEILNGMIRSIEADSDAESAYTKGAENAAIAGQGWWRVKLRYISDDSFDQEIYIAPGADPFGVLIDPMASLPDKSDMGFAFVYEWLSKEKFKADYPGHTADDFPKTMSTTGGFPWLKGESVCVAEYWCRETEKSTLYELDGGIIVDKLPKGAKAIRERDVETHSIVYYMMSGKEILSGPHAWAGKYIPIPFVPGEETTIEGATRRKGMVRDAKDPQRLLNYARTTEAESTALQPKAPFILTKDQIKGYETQWRTAGSENHPFLLINQKPGDATPLPTRSQPPVMSTGLQSLSQQAGLDLHDVTGIYPASLGAKSNETSGVAIRARQHEGDTGSNYIVGNVKRAVAYTGRILCDLIPKIYDTPRIVRTLKEDGSHDMQALNQPVEGLPDQVAPETDLALGEYDVVVSTGPGYLTRQQEMADQLVELSRTLPQVGQAAPDLLVKALGFPGGDEIAKRLEKLLPPGLTEDGPMQAPPPDPKTVAEAEETHASADLKKAQAAKTLLEADALASQMAAMGAQLQQLTQLVQSLGQRGPQGGSPQGPAGPMPPLDMPPPPAGPPNGSGAPLDDGGELVDMPQGVPA